MGRGSGLAGWRLRHLPPLLLVAAALLALAVLAGGALRGWAGALGAAAGVGVVVGSYLLSTLLLAWADSVDPNLVLPFGLTAYAVKFSLIGVLMVALSDRDWPGLVPMGFGVIAGVVVWNGVHIWWLTRGPGRVESAAGDSTRYSGEESHGSAE